MISPGIRIRAPTLARMIEGWSVVPERAAVEAAGPNAEVVHGDGVAFVYGVDALVVIVDAGDRPHGSGVDNANTLTLREPLPGEAMSGLMTCVTDQEARPDHPPLCRCPGPVPGQAGSAKMGTAAEVQVPARFVPFGQAGYTGLETEDRTDAALSRGTHVRRRAPHSDQRCRCESRRERGRRQRRARRDGVHSYVSDDHAKTFCVYDGPSPEAIRLAAERNGLPVDAITEVRVLDPYFCADQGRPRTALGRGAMSRAARPAPLSSPPATAT